MIPSELITIPRYLKIAVDLAARIVSGEIPEGEKLKGRSVLSTEYNVSPETVRRAMSILSDKQVVVINLGSGAVVTSRENAVQFVKSFKDDESISEMRLELDQMLEKRRNMDDKITSMTTKIIDMYKYMRNDLITPVEIQIPKGSDIIGKSIGKLRIWDHTGATVIGIIQGSDVIISPGSYYEFDQNDRILTVGDKNVVERFNAYVREVS
jgi:K+/H+ antiporter YhaU regulatory subunit KhtT